jgi:hypothetical protein
MQGREQELTSQVDDEPFGQPGGGLRQLVDVARPRAGQHARAEHPDLDVD